MIDVFVYVVVLNLAVEYLPSVISETFTLSLLTAVLLKVVLEIVTVFKKHLMGRFRSSAVGRGKILFGVSLWLLLVLSKFAVLELVALLFGDRVQLGGFFPVTGLIIVLMVSRTAVRRWLIPEQA